MLSLKEFIFLVVMCDFLLHVKVAGHCEPFAENFQPRTLLLLDDSYGIEQIQCDNGQCVAYYASCDCFYATGHQPQTPAPQTLLHILVTLCS